ncbi:hypothetical protein L2D08_07660 [Domibacillus sp. PGB-M46]|uniref:hypothetical protein n=1 Tax=Domibacillus sp. PGB-M46 TaxID=2910255 RepID=UPI001F57C9D3|nr:hypothetical protein [Domibacillus sp. PGB-M46]MCI2254237.1 hypothetical protein [Domibacillus sp. PGB-M46]
MARKQQKNIRIDQGVLAEFEKIANRKKQHHNAEIEELMKQYIARDGQLLFDDLYAPRIAHSVKQAVDDQINRLAKMIYKTQVESTAALYATPVFHNQIVKGVEDVLEMFLDARILNQNRIRISDQYSISSNGKQAVKNLRKMALTDHQEQKKGKPNDQMSV